MSHAGEYSCQITLNSSLLQHAISATSNTYTLNLQSEHMHCLNLQGEQRVILVILVIEFNTIVQPFDLKIMKPHSGIII